MPSLYLLKIQIKKILKDIDIIHTDNGIDAIELFEKNKDDIVLVITDVRISGDMDGYDVAKHIFNIKKVPMIILTGEYEFNSDLDRNNICFIRKPYNVDDLKKYMIKESIINNS